MFCPKCGQEQVTVVPNFCSRCGFQLTELTRLLASDGAPGETPENKPPRDKLTRYGMRLVMAALVFFALSLFSAAAEGDAMAIFGFLTFVLFVIGSCFLTYSWIRSRRRRRESDALGQQISRLEALQQGKLMSAPAPLNMTRARFDTGEVAEAPSVTEHTTRQLEHKPPRERERPRSRE